MQARALGRSPAALTRYQLEATSLAHTHNQGLDDALAADGFRKFIKAAIVEMFAWLFGGGVDIFDVEHAQPAARWRALARLADDLVRVRDERG